MEPENHKSLSEMFFEAADELAGKPDRKLEKYLAQLANAVAKKSKPKMRVSDAKNLLLISLLLPRDGSGIWKNETEALKQSILK